MQRCVLTRSILAASVAGLLLAGCQTTGSDTAAKPTPPKQVAKAVKPLSKAEVEALFTDKTLAWTSGKGAFYYGPNGALAYKQNWDGKKGDGSWRVSPSGELCFEANADWSKGEMCVTVFLDGTKMTTKRVKGGKTTVTQTTKFEKGNTL